MEVDLIMTYTALASILKVAPTAASVTPTKERELWQESLPIRG